MKETQENPTIEKDGWILVSAEEWHKAHPDTFNIPSRADRESLSPGKAAKLMFDIETKQNGRVIDRGIDRMWVIIKSKTNKGYVGILGNDPGVAENLNLRKGSVIIFGPEHIMDIENPSMDYIVETFGPSFFED